MRSSVSFSSTPAYYRSAADDELSTFYFSITELWTEDRSLYSLILRRAAHDWNRQAFSRVRLRPRVMRDVSTVDLTTTLLGHKSALPFFIAPAAMGRLAHPDGEKCLARGAKIHGIPYVVRRRLLFANARRVSRMVELTQVIGG